MKKILFIAITILTFSFSSYSQNNLEFNQVINLIGQSNGTSVVVPSGKVWKVEVATPDCVANNTLQRVVIAGITMYSSKVNAQISLVSYSPAVWLNAGSHSIGVGGCASASLSIIEFNVVP